MFTKKLIISSTFTADPLQEVIKSISSLLWQSFDLEFSPFNQVFQQLIDPSSLLSQNQKGCNFVLFRFEDWLRDNIEFHEKQDEEACRNKLNQYTAELIAAFKSFAARDCGQTFVLHCPFSPLIIKNQTLHPSFVAAEQTLYEGLKNISNVYPLSLHDFLTAYPIKNYYDPFTDKMGHIPYTKEMYWALGTFLLRKWHAANNKVFKVIVLDCDNTLWKGVCGEVGPLGVEITPAFKALQEFMHKQMKEGLLLCLCSKNVENDVWAVFSKNPNMFLQKNHLAGWRVNWQSKSQNLRELAEELNLDLNSFIFIDDNPIDCAEVRANCPTVLTLQLPQHEELIPKLLNHLWLFDRLIITAEDQTRTLLYQQERERGQFQNENTSLADFITGLNLNIQIASIAEEQYERVAQLTQRTNQFNTTTIRRNEAELKSFLEKPNNQVFTVKVTDRFGDYGLVGALFTEIEDQTLTVDTLLLSCRVLARGVEHAMIAHIGKWAGEKGISSINIPYKKTDRNEPIRNFLNGFLPQYKDMDLKEFNFHLTADQAMNITYIPSDSQPYARENAPSSEKMKSESPRSAETLAQTYIDLADLSKKVSEAKLFKEEHAVHQALVEKLKTELLTVPIEQRPKHVEVYLQHLVTKMTGRYWDEADRTRPLSESGMDSLLSVEFLNTLEKDFHLKKKINIYLLQNFPTVSSLSQWISENLVIQNTHHQTLKEYPEQNVEELSSISPHKDSSKVKWKPILNWTWMNDNLAWQSLVFRHPEAPVFASIPFEEKLDLEKLRQAIQNVYVLYPILSMEQHKLQLKFRVPKIKSPEIDYIDLLDTANQDEYVKQHAQKQFVNFSSKKRPIFFTLYKLKEDKYLLQLFVTHIFVDYHSATLLKKLINDNYQRIKQNKPPPNIII